jgi:hypothetical protein
MVYSMLVLEIPSRFLRKNIFHPAVPRSFHTGITFLFGIVISQLPKYDMIPEFWRNTYVVHIFTHP